MSLTPLNLENTVEFEIGKSKTALVDAADWPKISHYSWRWSEHTKNKDRGYVVTTARAPDGRYSTFSLHRLLMSNPIGKHVDHVNGDTTDNRRANLRLASRSQNMANTRKREGTSSKFKGVCWNKNCGTWQADIRANGKTIGLGQFGDEGLAALAYDMASIRENGEFANTNFPRSVLRLIPLDWGKSGGNDA